MSDRQDRLTLVIHFSIGNSGRGGEGFCDNIAERLVIGHTRLPLHRTEASLHAYLPDSGLLHICVIYILPALHAVNNSLCHVLLN